MTMSSIEIALALIVVADVVILAAIVFARIRGARGSRRVAAAPVESAVAPVATPAEPAIRREPGPAAADVIPSDAAQARGQGRARTEDIATVSRGRGALPDDPAIDEWHRVLRRESARAARYGRPAAVMQLEIEPAAAREAGAPDAVSAENALAGLITATIRASDYVVRTGPGRFHLLMTETDESTALWIAERIRSQFVRRVGDGRYLLVGWAGTQPPEGLESSVRRAAERVHQDRRRMQAESAGIRPIEPSPPAQPPQSPAALEVALSALERVWKSGLVTDDEYRVKRSEILGRL